MHATNTHTHMKPKANDIHDNPAASRTHKNDDNETMMTISERVTTMTVKCDNSLMCPANTTIAL